MEELAYTLDAKVTLAEEDKRKNVLMYKVTSDDMT
jgi:hypothetical protein